jgi:hypothetical protein
MFPNPTHFIYYVVRSNMQILRFCKQRGAGLVRASVQIQKKRLQIASRHVFTLSHMGGGGVKRSVTVTKHIITLTHISFPDNLFFWLIVYDKSFGQNFPSMVEEKPTPSNSLRGCLK